MGDDEFGGLRRRQSDDTPSQSGSRRGCGTTDAVFAVRRYLDLALAQRNGCTAMVALDWQKAFDAINVQALIIPGNLPSRILFFRKVALSLQFLEMKRPRTVQEC